MTNRTLSEWLEWQEQLHPSDIELGLTRVDLVWQRLHPDPYAPLVITIAGTNGKGSTVAYLEAILEAADYRTGTYTSPHLIRYNERIHIDGVEARDSLLCDAFERIDQARQTTQLTYFEFGTLAALDIFAREKLDVAILEVGLGGRLDAVNILDADAAVITSIGLDHTDWLGDDIDAIAREKAGVLRQDQPAVFADPDVPAGFTEAANEIGANVSYFGKDYSFIKDETSWQWQMGDKTLDCPLPAMRGEYQLRNAAGAIAILNLLGDKLPLSEESVRNGLKNARMAGRFQQVRSSPDIYIDVAHNREAATALAENLADLNVSGEIHALFSIYADKPVNDVVEVLARQVDAWHLYKLSGSRALTLDGLEASVRSGDPGAIVTLNDSLTFALHQTEKCSPGDAVVIFGSFEVAGEALEILG